MRAKLFGIIARILLVLALLSYNIFYFVKTNSPLSIIWIIWWILLLALTVIDLAKYVKETKKKKLF